MKIFLSLLLMSFFLSAAWSGTSFASDVSDGGQGGDMGNCCRETDCNCICDGTKPEKNADCCMCNGGTIYIEGLCCKGAAVVASEGYSDEEAKARCCTEAAAQQGLNATYKNGVCCGKWTTVLVGNCPVPK